MDLLEFDFSVNKDDMLNQLNLIKDKIINTATEVTNRVVQEKDVTFQTVIQPVIHVETYVEPLQSAVEYIEQLHVDESVRAHAMKVNKDINKFMIEWNMRKDLYNKTKEYYTLRFREDKDKLTDEEVRYVEHSMRDYRREGLELDDPTIKQMKQELSDICVQFSNNVNEVKTKFQFTKQQLNGMPDSWFKDKTEVNGTYTFTLKYPDYLPGMKYIRDESVRKQVYLAYNSRCFKENMPLLNKAVKLRSILAKKLGYTTHADFVTEVKIVKNAYTAINFLSNLNKGFTPLYHKDLKELYKFAVSHKDLPLTKPKLDQWDISYYKRCYTEEKFSIDMQEVKKYFPLETVKKGMFQIYEKLLGLEFSQEKNDNIWHNTVSYYKVNDAETKQVIGYFYLDMFPREGKYSHAAIFPLISGCALNNNPHYNTTNSRRLPVAGMVCNFPENDSMDFYDVETLFHEFGHVMHHLCSKVQLSQFSGFNVEGDFVEAPSQMLEYWCYEHESLSIMSGHEKTNEKIPTLLIDKLIKMKNIFQGLHNKRQLTFGLVDLALHTMDLVSEDEVNLVNKVNGLVEDILEYKVPDGTCTVSAFTHIVGGYDAGYYGYLRSETYASNMFYKMFKGKVLDATVGKLYRNKILKPGSSEDSYELLKDFLGEEPNDTYFLKEKGL